MNNFHHVAIKTNEVEWYVEFFEKIFGMKIKKQISDLKGRKIWFQEGIQINEDPDVKSGGGYLDHIAISTNEKKQVLANAIQYGCIQLKENWIQLPDGITIELMEI